MKRHHLVAVFLLIYGGLLAYIIFRHGDTDGASAIRMGIAFILFGAIGFFDGRLLSRLRVSVKAMMLLTSWGLLAYRDFMNGEIGSAFIIGIVWIVVGFSILFEGEPLVKEIAGPRLNPYIGMDVSSVVLIVVLLLLFFGR